LGSGLHATLKPEEPFVDDALDADDDDEEVTEEVTVKLPYPRRNGAMQIEMIHGGYMSSCKVGPRPAIPSTSIDLGFSVRILFLWAFPPKLCLCGLFPQVLVVWVINIT
jgi:hypothetical protein